MTDEIKKHFQECIERAEIQANDTALQKSSKEFFNRSHALKYSYNYTWLGRPIIQYPQDIVAVQECIYQVKPDLIIETGIAHGGSLIFSASMLTMLDLMEGVDPKESRRKVIGIDIDIRAHNRKEIENHPLQHKIQLVEGSSIDSEIINRVHSFAKGSKNIMVCLDSNHTEEHVFNELNAYAPLVTKGSYCIIFDTVIENMPEDSFPDRSWGKGNNPMTALFKWLEKNPGFEIDKSIDKKLLISVNPCGYLKRKE